MEESGQLHDPAALPLGKEPRYPHNRGTGWNQSRSGHFWRKMSLASATNCNARWLMHYTDYSILASSTVYTALYSDRKKKNQ